MSAMCLTCARRGGRQPSCPVCASIVPVPRHEIVRGIIARAAHEHRMAQIEADNRFKADFERHEQVEEDRRERERLCRRRIRQKMRVEGKNEADAL